MTKSIIGYWITTALWVAYLTHMGMELQYSIIMTAPAWVFFIVGEIIFKRKSKS